MNFSWQASSNDSAPPSKRRLQGRKSTRDEDENVGAEHHTDRLKWRSDSSPLHPSQHPTTTPTVKHFVLKDAEREFHDLYRTSKVGESLLQHHTPPPTYAMMLVGRGQSTLQRGVVAAPRRNSVEDDDSIQHDDDEASSMELQDRSSLTSAADVELCIRGPQLCALGNYFGWPALQKPDFFLLLYAVYSNTPFHQQSKMVITHSGFIEAMQRADFSKVQDMIDSGRNWMRTQLEDRNSLLFQGFYKFVFEYLLLTSRNFQQQRFARTIPTVDAKPALVALLGWYSPFTAMFCTYLDQHCVQSINLDQWRGFLHFVVNFRRETVHQEYSKEDSWPLLLDGFVDWLKAVQPLTRGFMHPVVP